MAADLLAELALHIFTGIKLVGRFFVEIFSVLWTVMWYGGIFTFVLLAVILIFFGIAVLKYTMHNIKRLGIILIVLAIIAFLTALGLVL